MAHLIQIFLPMAGAGRREEQIQFLAHETKLLTEKFGGATSFVRSPADGYWSKGKRGLEKDIVVLIEVLTSGWHVEWWAAYKLSLEKKLDQEAILIRRMDCEIVA